MKIEEKFNLRSAELIDVQSPTIHVGRHLSELGIKMRFHPQPGEDRRSLHMHLTPDEALDLAAQLIEAVQRSRPRKAT